MISHLTQESKKGSLKLSQNKQGSSAQALDAFADSRPSGTHRTSNLLSGHLPEPHLESCGVNPPQKSERKLTRKQMEARRLKRRLGELKRIMGKLTEEEMLEADSIETRLEALRA